MYLMVIQNTVLITILFVTVTLLCSLSYVRHLPSPVCRICPFACLRISFTACHRSYILLSRNSLFCSRDSNKHMSRSDITPVALGICKSLAE